MKMMLKATCCGWLAVLLGNNNVHGIHIPGPADGDHVDQNRPIHTTPNIRDSLPHVVYVGDSTRTRNYARSGLRNSPCYYDDSYLAVYSSDCGVKVPSSSPTALKVMAAILGVSLVAILLIIFSHKLYARTRSRGTPRTMQLVTAHRTLQALVPPWVSVRPHISREDDTGWSRSNIGENIIVINNKTLRPVRPPAEEDCGIEGAICSRGFSEGKHVFTFMWPRDQRFVPGAHICVGVGYSCHMQQYFEPLLVGGNKSSIGFSLTENTLYFGGKTLASYPPRKQPHFCVPTLFYMYLNLDENRLSFGTEEEKWGLACEFRGFRTQQTDPIFPMVAFRNVTGKFMMFYKGEVHVDAHSSDGPSPSEDNQRQTGNRDGRPTHPLLGNGVEGACPTNVHVLPNHGTTWLCGNDNHGFEADQPTPSTSTLENGMVGVFAETDLSKPGGSSTLCYSSTNPCFEGDEPSPLAAHSLEMATFSDAGETLGTKDVQIHLRL